MANRGGQVTDDTQMTLFTAEGLIRGFVRGWSGGGGSVPEAVHGAYQRWLLTQEQDGPDLLPLQAPYDGWLLRQQFLYARRAPGNACMTGVAYHREFETPSMFGQPGPINAHSKGCGTVMRSAPFGLARLGVEQAFGLAAQCAQLTHGHPTGYLAAGAFAALIERVTAGTDLRTAVEETIEQTAGFGPPPRRPSRRCGGPCCSPTRATRAPSGWSGSASAGSPRSAWPSPCTARWRAARARPVPGGPCCSR